MKISLLVPTRRPAAVEVFMESVWKMTHQKKNIEVLFACDNDDLETPNKIKELIDKYGRHIEMYLHQRERSELLNEDYYNWLSRKAGGDLFWVLADDIILMVPGWDVIINREVESFYNAYPDTIVCCSIRDNTPPPSHRLPKFPCFPMVSKKTRDVMGWVLHPKIPTWGADYIGYMIFQPIGRLLEFKDKNYINHVCSHNHQVAEDEINTRIGSIFNRLKHVPHHSTHRILAEEVPMIRRDLTNYIKNFKKPIS